MKTKVQNIEVDEISYDRDKFEVDEKSAIVEWHLNFNKREDASNQDFLECEITIKSIILDISFNNTAPKPQNPAEHGPEHEGYTERWEIVRDLDWKKLDRIKHELNYNYYEPHEGFEINTDGIEVLRPNFTVAPTGIAINLLKDINEVYF